MEALPWLHRAGMIGRQKPNCREKGSSAAGWCDLPIVTDRACDHRGPDLVKRCD
jgi:hypothetical protein